MTHDRWCGSTICAAICSRSPRASTRAGFHRGGAADARARHRCEHCGFHAGARHPRRAASLSRSRSDRRRVRGIVRASRPAQCRESGEPCSVERTRPLIRADGRIVRRPRESDRFGRPGRDHRAAGHLLVLSDARRDADDWSNLYRRRASRPPRRRRRARLRALAAPLRRRSIHRRADYFVQRIADDGGRRNAAGICAVHEGRHAPGKAGRVVGTVLPARERARHRWHDRWPWWRG